GIVATGAMSIGHKGMLYAAKALALTAAGLYTDPTHLERARTEFQAATDGQPYRCPLPPDLAPSLPAD
ncbi:MAG TPA: hypothetical protein VFW96_23445, partial [Thermomicrobiales bacterium]|nr:hypothetical protein [Thermomicrobiales bacterium]